MLVNTESDGSLRLRPFGAVAESGRGLLKGLVPDGESLVDDLQTERRLEAEAEDRD